MPTKKRFTSSQWVQVGGSVYDQGTPPYQEGGWSPLWALAGQGAMSLGKEMACKAAKRFRRSYCTDGAPPPKKKKKKTTKPQQKGGIGFDQAAWEMIKGMGKAGAQAARMGAGKVIQSDWAQKKATDFVSPFIGQALDTIGDKVAGQQGGFLDLLPALVKQLGGSGSNLYQSGTDPYQEGGFLPLLALGGLIPGLVKQLGGGQPFQTLSKLAKQGVIPHLIKKQKGKGRTVKSKRPKVVTGSSLTLKRLFRKQGGRNVGVLPEVISGPQVGMGRQRRRPGRHCFQGLP